MNESRPIELEIVKVTFERETTTVNKSFLLTTQNIELPCRPLCERGVPGHNADLASETIICQI